MRLAERTTDTAPIGAPVDTGDVVGAHRFGAPVRRALPHFVAAIGAGPILDVQPITTGYEDLNLLVTTPAERLVVKVFDQRRTTADCHQYVERIRHATEQGVRHPALKRPAGSSGALLTHETDGRLFHGCAMDHEPAPSLYQRGGRLTAAEQDDLMTQVARLAGSRHDHPPAAPDPWSALELHRQLERADLPEGPVRRLATCIAATFDLEAVAALPLTFVHADLVPTNLLCPGDGTVVVIDFGRAGTLPRIHELAVLATYTAAFHSTGATSTEHRSEIDELVAQYERHHPLTVAEHHALPSYIGAVAAACMVTAELERRHGNTSAENCYWLRRATRVAAAALRLRSSERRVTP